MEETETEATEYAGFEEALTIVRQNTGLRKIEELPIEQCAGHVSYEEVCAVINNPPVDASAKDGFAVRSEDVSTIRPDYPRRLKIIGSVFAGGVFEGVVEPGQAVTICSGAPIPEGADAVVASELCDEDGEYVCIRAEVQPGTDIIPAGENVEKGMKVIEKDQVISPVIQSFAATAGAGTVKVYRKPRVALISIGDELVVPGNPLKDGQIYASNLVYNSAWLHYLGIPFDFAVVKDDAEDIRKQVIRLIQNADTIITSGGVMHSERDLIVGVLNDLGWELKFRHVRMGPGKATAFGILDGKPVFCFSGGPGSNSMSFLQFALPGIYNMLGFEGDPLTILKAQLLQDVKSRNQDWTEFRDGILEKNNGSYTVTPLAEKSSFRSKAMADCLIVKPEGAGSLQKGQIVSVQLLPDFRK